MTLHQRKFVDRRMGLQNMDSTVKWVSTCSIPSDRSRTADVLADLTEEMSALGWPEDDVMEVEVACEEALVNAIVHGNKNITSASVEISATCDHEHVRVEIADQGPGFDTQNVPDPRKQTRREMPGGRGLLMMREIMSEVTYNSVGNRVTMIKRRQVRTGWTNAMLRLLDRTVRKRES